MSTKDGDWRKKHPGPPSAPDGPGGDDAPIPEPPADSGTARYPYDEEPHVPDGYEEQESGAGLDDPRGRDRQPPAPSRQDVPYPYDWMPWRSYF